MANTQTIIAAAYSAFNRRNVEGALALMSENVSWPRASEGGRVAARVLTANFRPVRLGETFGQGSRSQGTRTAFAPGVAS